MKFANRSLTCRASFWSIQYADARVKCLAPVWDLRMWSKLFTTRRQVDKNHYKDWKCIFYVTLIHNCSSRPHNTLCRVRRRMAMCRMAKCRMAKCRMAKCRMAKCHKTPLYCIAGHLLGLLLCLLITIFLSQNTAKHCITYYFYKHRTVDYWCEDLHVRTSPNCNIFFRNTSDLYGIDYW